MGVDELNAVSLGVTILLALVGTPVLLRRAGYPFGKTAFGTLTVVVVLLGVWGIVATLQRKAGIEAVPLGWLVPLAALGAAWRLHRQPS